MQHAHAKPLSAQRPSSSWKPKQAPSPW
jgi:hypothetical protein